MDSFQDMYGADTKMKVVFTGRLCNFTKKITHDFGTEIKYQNDPKANKVNSVISQLQDIQNEIYKSKNTPITFACIPPICISKYRDYNYNSFDLKKKRYKLQKSIFSELETEIQQKNLDKDLHLTNEKICELNNAIGNLTSDGINQSAKPNLRRGVEWLHIIMMGFMMVSIQTSLWQINGLLTCAPLFCMT
jgi:hypothetical protein